MPSAVIDEIFSSIQGEGPWVGQRQIFVRFTGCDIRCRYCDTPAARNLHEQRDSLLCRAQKEAGSLDREPVPAVFSAERLNEHCFRLIIPGPSRPVLSLTGGEPLLHHEFLLTWLPTVRKRFSVYLETNGICHQAMESIHGLVDVVSMDFKVPSATGLRAFWEEHRRFLTAARGTKLFVKVVVTNDTLLKDIVTSAEIVAGLPEPVPLVLQPVAGPLAPGPALLIEFQDTALGIVEDVRVIPQAHKLLQVP